MNHFGLKKASSWTQVSSVRAKRPFIYLPLWARHSMQVQTMRKRRREGNEWAAGVERRYTIQRTIRWLSRTAVRWGPTILFECPAQTPRSSLRSFSLWARHSAETSAELNVRSGAAEFFPVASRQVRGGGSGGGKEMSGRRGSSVGTRYNVRSAG